MASNAPFGNDRTPQFSALMVAHLANDLKLLLGTMLNCVDSIRARIPSAVDVEQDFAAFETAIDNAFYLSRELIALGAPKAGEPGVLNVNDLLRHVRGMLERVLGPRVRLVYDLSATSSTVRAEAVQLEWMLLNLAVNGRDAMADGGTLTIETTSIDTAPKDVRAMSRYQSHVRLTVRDTGGGMIPDVQMRMFEPFFTTKPGGTGLGLTAVAITTRLLNGSLHVRSNEPHGTEVNIYLPVVTKDV
jgi:signal transduction histidine kinase